MIKGSISCKCGSSFSFESILDTIDCPNCGKEHIIGNPIIRDYEEELAHDYDLDHDAEEKDESE